MLALAGFKAARDDIQKRILPFDLLDTHPYSVLVSTHENSVLLFAGNLACFTVDTVFII
jgi:hypothetical protein